MKLRAFLRVLFAAILFCAAGQFLAAASEIRFVGGDGSSPEKAILIKGANEQTGVRAEYEYLAKHFPGSKPAGQALQNWKGRTFDVLRFTASDGKKMALFFDITEFFGK